MHQLRFSLTGRDLAAVEHLAEARAAEYYGPGYEPLLTRSRAEPNFTGEGVHRTRDGWRVTFLFHCRPVAQELHGRRRAVRAVPNTEPGIEPYGDGHPTEGTA